MRTAAASVVMATVASACCIGPVVLVLLGIGTLGASLASLEPYRPIFLGVTGVLLGFAFYAAYRPLSACDVCSSTARRRSQIAVWLSAIMVTMLAAFPYYVRFLF